MPALHVPGEVLDGVPYYRPLHSERANPGAIMVDGTGRRFVNEAQNYGDVGRAMARGAPGPGAWLVFDAACRRRYPVGPRRPRRPRSPWLSPGRATWRRWPRPSACAADACVTTVDRLQRGGAPGSRTPNSAAGRFPTTCGSVTRPPLTPRWRPWTRPPSTPCRVHLGCMGTKGGPATDDRGRVLAARRRRRPALYAAGNVAANPFGTATPAGGATLGPALVFGFRAGEAAAGDR